MTGKDEIQKLTVRNKSLIQALNVLGARLDASLRLLGTICSLTTIPLNSRTLEEATGKSLEILVQGLENINGCSVMVYDPEVDRLTLLAAKGPADLWNDESGPFNKDLTFRAGEGAAGWAYKENVPYFLNPNGSTPEILECVSSRTCPQSLACLPLTQAERQFGILNISFMTPKPFDQPRKRDLTALSGVISNIIQTFMLMEEVDAQAGQLREKVNECELEIRVRKSTEDALRASEKRYRTVLENTPEPVVVCDNMMKISYLNPSFSRVFGWTSDEVRGRSIEQIPPEMFRYSGEMMEYIRAGKPFYGIESRRLTKNGRPVDVCVSGGLFFDDSGNPQGSVITFQDITERKRNEEEISFFAHHDVLTGLPNRKSFYLRLEEMIDQSKRWNVQENWALLFLDLDRFKNINDSLGHDVGDQLLISVAGRIQEVLRKSDHIFRLGGDEFTIILSRISQGIDVARVAGKIREHVSKPYKVQGYDLFITVSIGISVYPNDGRSVEQLVKYADMAMYAAKGGGDGYRFYTEEMNRKALDRLRMESRLRNALENDQFVIYYQPIVDKRESTIGMEALLRWQHPDLGLIGPTRFIPVAEETGAIVSIGEWVIRRACEQLQVFHGLGYSDLFVTINLSPRQFKAGDLVERVGEIIGDVGIKPTRIKFEVTEGCVMEDPDEAIRKMNLMRSMGIGFSIDDFGTGYSSLSYLKRFPIETLKIDRSFIKESTYNQDDREIIRAVISMAGNLRVSTLAEGVELKEQRDFLVEHGCNTMQGFYYGRPMNEMSFKRFLKNGSGYAPGIKN